MAFFLDFVYAFIFIFFSDTSFACCSASILFSFSLLLGSTLSIPSKAHSIICPWNSAVSVNSLEHLVHRWVVTVCNTSWLRGSLSMFRYPICLAYANGWCLWGFMGTVFLGDGVLLVGEGVADLCLSGSLSFPIFTVLFISCWMNEGLSGLGLGGSSGGPVLIFAGSVKLWARNSLGPSSR